MVEFEGYCMKCKKKVIVKSAEELITKNNKKMVKGSCPNCSTNVCKIIGKA